MQPCHAYREIGRFVCVCPRDELIMSWVAVSCVRTWKADSSFLEAS